MGPNIEAAIRALVARNDAMSNGMSAVELLDAYRDGELSGTLAGAVIDSLLAEFDVNASDLADAFDDWEDAAND